MQPTRLTDQKRPSFIFLALMISLNVLFITIGITTYDAKDGAWGMADTVLWCLIPLLFLALLLLFKQETVLDDNGVYYMLFPMQRKPVNIPWTEVAAGSIRTVRPIADFGGWGMRQRNGVLAINISGNTGIQLRLKNGRQVFIGTRNTAQVSAYLEILAGKGIIIYHTTGLIFTGRYTTATRSSYSGWSFKYAAEKWQ